MLLAIYFDSIGLIHLLASILSLIAGTAILLMRKGTQRHRQIGYVYAFGMSIVILTAFMIYRLFGGFGPFHIAAIVSFVTLVLGMLPILYRWNNWQYMHLSFMYWSVMGLYAAFASETLVRLPAAPFWGTVGIATTAIMVIGGIVFGMNKERWRTIFDNELG